MYNVCRITAILFLVACFTNVVSAKIVFGILQPGDDQTSSLVSLAHAYAKAQGYIDYVDTEVVEIATKESMYSLCNEGCKVLNTTNPGVDLVAIVGPPEHNFGPLYSYFSKLPVFYLDTTWHVSDHAQNVFFPRADLVVDVIKDIAQREEWSLVALVLQDKRRISLFKRLLQVSAHNTNKRGFGIELVVFELLPDVDGDYVTMWKHIRKSGINKFIVDCRPDMLHKILSDANRTELLTIYYHYIFSSLAVTDVHLKDFSQVGANLTFMGIRNEMAKKREVSDILRNFNLDLSRRELLRYTARDALIFDGVVAFISAIAAHSANHIYDNTFPEIKTGRCRKRSGLNEHLFFDVKSLIKTAKGIKRMRGLSGGIDIDDSGHRPGFELTLAQMDLGTARRRDIASWDRPGKMALLKQETSPEMEAESVLAHMRERRLVVTTIMEEPFVRYREAGDTEILRGNARYEGYCVDLLDALAKEVNFTYEIREVADGEYGSNLDKRLRTWNGMVGELMTRKADMAVAPLTITFIREQVIDFTAPFMHLGISILFKQASEVNPGVFSFTRPIHPRVWLYIFVGWAGASIVLFIIGRISPKEKEEGEFTMYNSFWFTLATLFSVAGCDVTPRSTATRALSTVWSFFALIMISSYTANLAAFMTVSRMKTKITSAEDLAKQTEIAYGTRSGGSTSKFFKNSNISTYEKMWKSMSAAPHVFVDSSDEGIKRVKEGKYAYLMESVMLEYSVAKDCELTQIGGLLDSKGYGIGLPRGSPLRKEISSAVLRLQELQILRELQDRWWKQKVEKVPGCDEHEAEDATSSQKLSFAQLAGIFIVLLAGLGLSLVVVSGELVRHTHGLTKEYGGSMCFMCCSELLNGCRRLFGLKQKTPIDKTRAKSHFERSDIKSYPEFVS